MSALRVRASNLRLTCFRGLAFAAQCGGRAFLSRADCLLTGAFAASGPHPLTCAWSPWDRVLHELVEHESTRAAVVARTTLRRRGFAAKRSPACATCVGGLHAKAQRVARVDDADWRR